MAVAFGPTTTFSGGFSIRDMPISTLTNTPYEVELSAGADGEPNFSGSAWVDPTIKAPAGYQLYFSSGIENGVPEPAAWAMMLVGIGAVGGLVRRRRTLARSLAF